MHYVRAYEVTNMTKAQKAAETRKQNAAFKARMALIHSQVAAVIASGKCPDCGSALRRNLSLAGWYQCEQYGAETHRARASDPTCNWQGFTE